MLKSKIVYSFLYIFSTSWFMNPNFSTAVSGICRLDKTGVQITCNLSNNFLLLQDHERESFQHATYVTAKRPGAHPASYMMDTGSFLGRQSGWGMALATHLQLAPRLKKE
jgi:hypothetical protein